MPKFLARIIAQLILLVLEHLLADRLRRAALAAAKAMEQSNAPQETAPKTAVAAPRAPRRPADNAWRKEFPQLARLLAAVRHAPLTTDGEPPSPPEQAACEAASAEISPAADAAITAVARSARPAVHAPPLMRRAASASPTSWRQNLARAGTGPPTGPPVGCDYAFPFCIA